MRTFYIVRRANRRERIDRILPAILAVPLTIGWLSIGDWGTRVPLRVTFYAALVAFGAYILWTLARVAREPVNYRSLRLSSSGLEYEPLSRERITIAWKEIERIVFCREEAVFPDPGPYLETKWFVKVHGSEKLNAIMDEWGNRRSLLRAFAEYLPGFDSGSARTALRSRKEGKWVCLDRSPRDG